MNSSYSGARRIALAVAAFGAVTALGACATTDDSEPEAPPADLAIDPENEPDYQLQTVPDEDLTQYAEQDAEIIQNMHTEPAECAAANESPIKPDTPLEDVNLQVGQLGEQQVRLYVFNNTEFVQELAKLQDECQEMNVTIDNPETEESLRADITNEPFDAEAAEGVDDFTSVVQSSTANVGEEAVETKTITVSGAVRGKGVQVAVLGFQGEVPDEARQQAVEIFDKQAAKIRDAE